jgi:AcrR family transcriptional regulator
MPRRGLDAAAVIAAAARLADEHGLESVTIARLAEALDVKPPSLYAHIAGLEDLRRRLGARGAGELAVVLAQAAAGRARRDALEAVAAAYRGYAREHPGAYAALQHARGDSAQAVVDVVLAMLRGYRLEAEEAIHATRAIRAALHGFAELEAKGGFGVELALDESFERLVAVLDRGLTE